jgi:2,3-dihydroxybenzoate decarboxylase
MRVIDFESHIHSKEYAAFLRSYRGYPRYREDRRGRISLYYSSSLVETRESFFEKLVNLKMRLADMKQAGIDQQVLSLAVPGCERFPREASIKIARTSNNALSKIVNEYPHRFYGFGALPLPSISDSLDEIKRVVLDLGFKGLILPSNVNGKYFDSKEFSPLFDLVQKFRVPIFLHPTIPVDANSLSKYDLWGASLGFGTDAAKSTLRLIYGGILENYQGLRIILGHLGETLPFIIKRIDIAYSREKDKFKQLKHEPSFYVKRNFYVDTAGIWHEPSLSCTINTLGRKRILFASDYPFDSILRNIAFIKACHLSETELRAICWKNASDLLKIAW